MEKTDEKEMERVGKDAAQFIDKLVTAVEQYFEGIAKDNADPNMYRDNARDMIVEKGLGKKCAANIVRLAVCRYNLKNGGGHQYTHDELKQIIGHVANFKV